jgi:hydroxymethylpyrimidine/phosphomethylpyrimidine kinase
VTDAPPRIAALSIAGSDSGGGAGVQADLLSFAAFGVHGCTALTALTAQSTVEVRAVHPVPPAFVRAQVETVLADLPVRAIKTGMLLDLGIVREVARLAAEHPGPWVVDPVMVASSGARLLEPEAERALAVELLPRAHLVTPNLDEAGVLLGAVPRRVPEMIEAGRRLVGLGARAALVKGGHLEGAPTDVLVDGAGAAERVVVLEGRRIDTRATHGTGCSYAAAITAGLALGAPLEAAVRTAHAWLAAAIASARPIGRGFGPIDHLHARPLVEGEPAARAVGSDAQRG